MRLKNKTTTNRFLKKIRKKGFDIAPFGRDGWAKKGLFYFSNKKISGCLYAMNEKERGTVAFNWIVPMLIERSFARWSRSNKIGFEHGINPVILPVPQTALDYKKFWERLIAFEAKNTSPNNLNH